MEPVQDYYDESSGYAGAAVLGVFATLFAIYWVLAELLEAPVWLAILVDVAFFVTCFATWVRRENAQIRADAEKMLQRLRGHNSAWGPRSTN